MISPRRKFLSQLLAFTSAGVALPSFSIAHPELGSPASVDDESYWEKLQKQFIVPSNRIMMNAANLCPSPQVVHERMIELTRSLNQDVSFQYRSLFADIRRKSISMMAKFVNADETEIGITRNTSEGNCMIAHGLDLKSGDEVILWDQNHASNKEVWISQSKRMGIVIKLVSVPANPSSGAELTKPFIDAITPNTRLISFSHVSNVSGIAMPAKEICQTAKSRGIMTLVDGAQSLGSMPVDVHDMGCSFYSSSTHKWLLGSFENGLLYINKEFFPRVWPGVIGGGWKESTTVDENLCVLGQRNEPSPAALPEVVSFHEQVGRKNIESRVVHLAQYLKAEIKRSIPTASFVTPLSPDLSKGVVVVKIPGKEIHEVCDQLYHRYGLATAPSGGIRLSPHIYNTMKDIDYAVKALAEVTR